MNKYEKAKLEHMAGLTPKARTDFLLGKRFEPPYVEDNNKGRVVIGVDPAIGDSGAVFNILDGQLYFIKFAHDKALWIANDNYRAMQNYLVQFDNDYDEGDDFNDYYDPMHELRM